MHSPRIRRISWLILLLAALASTARALDVGEQVRAKYPGLLEALAVDGVQLDFEHAQLDRSPSDPKSTWARISETGTPASRPWAVEMELDLENDRVRNAQLVLKAHKKKSFPYDVQIVSWRIDGLSKGANAFAKAAPPGADEAYDRAGERIFRDRLPATFAYFNSLERRRMARAYLALGVTLVFGLVSVFFAVTQPKLLCRWTVCNGRWSAASIFMTGVAISIVVLVNPSLTEDFFTLDIFLVWALAAAGATAALALNASSRDLDHFTRGLLILTTLGLALAVTLGVAGVVQLDVYAFIMGYFVAMTPLSLGLQKGWLRSYVNSAGNPASPADRKTAAPPPPEAPPW
ncbi:hypothetical protein [Oceanithermus sp.]|uniref:hypothetical protein n=1 Tax=Oceanithermus sp. TaxID=2268145 RepID=UPI002579C0BD|nr:hypothetical protein [Oceanithermus sp.]